MDLSSNTTESLLSAVQGYKDALTALPEQAALRPSFLKEVGKLYFELYSRDKSNSDLDEAIVCFKAALSAEERPNGKVEHLIYLGDAFYARYLVRYLDPNSLADLDASIKMGQELVGIPAPIKLVKTLAQRLRDRYMRTRSTNDLYESIRLQQLALNALEDEVRTKTEALESPVSRESRANSFYHLGLVKRDLFLEKQSNGLDEAIQLFEKAYETALEADLERIKYLSGIGIGLLDRYTHNRTESDLDRAVKTQRRAVEALSSDSSYRPEIFGSFGNALYYLHRHSNSDNALEEAVNAYQVSIDETPTNSMYRAQRLNSLAVIRLDRYIATHSESDFNEATKSADAVLKVTPKNHPNYPTWLHNLALCFFNRYRATSSLEDLQKAIDYGGSAVEASSEGHEGRSGKLNSLGALFRARYKRLGLTSDFQAALSLTQRAKEMTSKDHVDYAVMVNNLGGLYLDRYVREDPDLEILEKAIHHRQLAVEVSSEGDPNRPDYRSNLAGALSRRAKANNSIDDLITSIQLLELAVKDAPEDHPRIASRLNQLGSAYFDRYNMSSSQQDLSQALACCSRSLHQANGVPFERVLAGERAAWISMTQENWEQAANYLEKSVDLLPKVTIRTNASRDHQDNLKRLSSLGPVTASVFLKAGRTDLDSLQILEKARGVIAGLIIDSRSDVSLLREQHPDLYSKYCTLREIVARASFSKTTHTLVYESSPPEEYASMSIRRSENLRKLEEVEEKIRRTAGFERFQMAPTEMELFDLAQDGPLVSFNITEYGSHAFLVSSQVIKALPLHKVTLKDLEECVRSMPVGNKTRRNAKKVSTGTVNKAENDTLIAQEKAMGLLWDAAIKPVLLALGLLDESASSQSPPCIWWVGGGMMALLPLHAAGYPYKSNTMDFVVSSYAPTFKTMQYSRIKAWSPPSGKGNILIVSIPKTPHHLDLNHSG